MKKAVLIVDGKEAYALKEMHVIYNGISTSEKKIHLSLGNPVDMDAAKKFLECIRNSYVNSTTEAGKPVFEFMDSITIRQEDTGHEIPVIREYEFTESFPTSIGFDMNLDSDNFIEVDIRFENVIDHYATHWV